MVFTHTDTDLPIENEYPKLVRDKIPELIQRDKGLPAKTRTAKDDSEYLAYLLKKVAEEAVELSKTATDDHLQEELADVYEVIDAILKLKGLSPSDIKAVKDDKRRERGGFDRRIVVTEKP